MDNRALIEMIVKRKDTIVTYIKKAFILITGITFCMVSLFAIPVFGAVISFFIGWMCWILWAKQYVEYEYSFFNGEMDVDMIVAKRKRKRLLTVNFKRIYVLAKLEGTYFNEYSKGQVIDVSSQGDAKDCYFVAADGAKGRYALIFEPNERLLEAIIAAAGQKYRA